MGTSYATLVGGQTGSVVTGINSRAVGKQGEGESWATVIDDRAKQRVGVVEKSKAAGSSIQGEVVTAIDDRPDTILGPLHR